MAEYVALLRGANVGGVKVLSADLKRLALAQGWTDPQTYIASGNLVFGADDGPKGAGANAVAIPVDPAHDASGDLAHDFAGVLRVAYGRDVPVLVRAAARFRAVLGECPFAPAEGRHVHGFLPIGALGLDHDLYRRLRRDSEELVLTPGAAWLFAPDGVGRSDLALRIEKVLGGAATGRNLNTLRALAEMLDARGAA